MDKIYLLLPGLLISAISLYLAIDARRHSRRREGASDWQARIDGLRLEFLPLLVLTRTMEADLLVLKKQVEIFWKGVSFSSAQALHSPHSPELDILIEKFQRGQIDDEELGEFKAMLRHIETDDTETAFRRKAASEVLILIKIQYEVKTEVVAA